MEHLQEMASMGNHKYMSHQQNINVDESLMDIAEEELEIIKNWYLRRWISYKEFLRLTKLPF